MDDATVPDKPYLRIGEVSRITGVKPYVLRYWESEFPSVAPSKTRTNQRLYRREDVERILTIKRLLYTERYTIAGARAKLEATLTAASRADGEEGGGRPTGDACDQSVRDLLLRLRDELQSLRSLLDE